MSAAAQLAAGLVERAIPPAEKFWAEIDRANQNKFVTTNEVDWGSRARGQGKRMGSRKTGGMVRGAMSDAPTGKKIYLDPIGKAPLSPSEREEANSLDRIQMLMFSKALAAGHKPEVAFIAAYTVDSRGEPAWDRDKAYQLIADLKESGGTLASNRRPRTMSIADQLREAVDGDEFPVDEAFLKDVAKIFNKKYAKSNFIMGTPEVKSNGKLLYLNARLQGYNDAKVDALSIWIDAAGKARMTVSGSAAGDDVETQGFTHAHAEAEFKYNGETAEQLAKKAFDLSKKMK